MPSYHLYTMAISNDSDDSSINTKNSEINSSETPTIDYFRDKSLVSGEEDKFKHLHYVEVLKDILLKSETPLNVGLYGKWGVGKSSIVHMLKEELEKDPLKQDFKYVEVDAWGLSGNSLQQGILEEINFQLGEVYKQNDLEDVLYNIQEVESLKTSKILKSYWWIWAIIAGITGGILYYNQTDIVTTLSAIGFSTIIGALIPLTKLFLSSSKKIIPKAVSAFQFNEIYKKMVDTTQKKLVVVIDNLDRCDDKIAVELLGIIQTFMVKSNSINILACDDEAIITHLKNVKGQYTDRDGNEFLSKFFQVTIRIPPFIGENLEKYTEELMSSRSVKFNPFVRNILISGAIENPRKINQFLNNAVALYRLAEFKENDQKLPKGVITDHTDFLTKIIVIRHEWPEFYKVLENQPDILKKSETLDSWLNKDKENPEITRLQKFLNATQYAYVDDVTPFLRLNQESFASESGIEEFAIAVSTLDPKAKELFSLAESSKQNQYLKKIEDMMNKNSSIGDNLTLVNCTLSVIGILESVEEKPMRDQILAILGKHFSENLLSVWDKFDIEKLNLFSILEEMLPIFSNSFYRKLIDETFTEEQLNENLFNLFIKNGAIISKSIMDEIDEKYSVVVEHPVSNLEKLVKLCTENNWKENNITKPSRTISILIENITFAIDGSDVAQIEIYDKIEESIDSTEQKLYLEKIYDIIKTRNTTPEILSENLINTIQKQITQNLNENKQTKEQIFKVLCENLEKNPDPGQSEKILDLIIEFETNLSNVSDLLINPQKLLEENISKYLLQKATHDIILNLLNRSETEDLGFLKSEMIISNLMKRFVSLGANNADIIRILLRNNTYETRKIISEYFDELISSKESSKYSVLLTTAEEDDPNYNEDIIESIRKSCKTIADDEEFSERFTFYQHVLKLKPKYYETKKIVDYLEYLIGSDNVSEQDQGMVLSRSINSTSKRSEPVGITKALNVALDLLNQNSERVIQFLGFIYEQKDALSYSQKILLIKILRIGLESTSENIVNNIVEYVKQSPNDVMKEIFDELLECIEKCPFGHAKEQCKQLLISQKENIRIRHVERLKEIFGENVLD